MDTFKIRATARVPEAFIPPSEPWPKHRVSITLKNLGDSIIQYSYSEDGIKKDGIITNDLIDEKPTKFFVNTTYMFNLRTGARVENIS